MWSLHPAPRGPPSLLPTQPVSSHFPVAAPRPLGCEFLGGPQCSRRPGLAEACPTQPSTCDPDGGGRWGLASGVGACRSPTGLGLVCSGASWIDLQSLPALSFLGHLAFLKPLRCVDNAYSFHGPSAKVNVRVVLKTYVISPWESEWRETFFFFLFSFKGGLGGRRKWKGFLFFHFSSITLTRDTIWMSLVSRSSKCMNLY